MNIEFPPDARVQIFVAPAGATPFTDAMLIPSAPHAARPHRLLLKGTVLLALVGGAYFFGGHSSRPAVALQARAQTAEPQTSAEVRGRGASQDVPPAFAHQLQQPPVVTPPPEASPSTPSAKSAFGLED